MGIILSFFTNLSFAAEVNVFSARHYDSDIQLYKKFTEKTGIKVNVVSGKDKALQKRIMKRELTLKQIFILQQMQEDWVHLMLKECFKIQ